jgi:hypothetical protein
MVTPTVMLAGLVVPVCIATKAVVPVAYVEEVIVIPFLVIASIQKMKPIGLPG